jgi:hypothetical protein
MKTVIKFLSYLAQFFFEWKLFQTNVRDKLETHILYASFFNAVYEIICNNIFERGRSHTIIWLPSISVMEKSTALLLIEGSTWSDTTERLTCVQLYWTWPGTSTSARCHRCTRATGSQHSVGRVLYFRSSNHRLFDTKLRMKRSILTMNE